MRVRPLPRRRTLLRVRTAKSPCGCEPKPCPGAGETGCSPVSRDRKWYRNDPHRRGCRAPVRCAIVEGSAVPRELSPQHVEYGKGAFRPAFTPQSIGACVPGKGARGVAWRALLRGGAASPPQVRYSAGTVADRRRSS